MWVWMLLAFLPGSVPLLPNELQHQPVKNGMQVGKGAAGNPQVKYLVGTSPVCSRIPGLSTGQRKLCQLYQDHMRGVIRGAALAAAECQWQFSLRRWNCSTLNRKNILGRAGKGGKLEIVIALWNESKRKVWPWLPPVLAGTNPARVRLLRLSTQTRVASSGNPLSDHFCRWIRSDRMNLFYGRLMPLKTFHACFTGSREAAFTTALLSAAVSHSVTLACREGQLSSCSCSRSGRPKSLRADFVWGGCGDNLQYGYKFTKEFIDVREKEKNSKKSRDRDKRAMTLHNNEAGRWAVMRKVKPTCKCHGLSGSCTYVTCWQQLEPFREVGDFLKEKYDEAIEVEGDRRGKLKIKDPQYSPRSEFHLVYLEESPNYCVQNTSIGIPGTQGRVCNRTSIGMDSCNLLCCGRGYNTQKTTSKQMCNCRFVWCCKVQCQQCVENVEVHTCK